MLPCAEYQSLPGSPHSIVRSGPDEFPNRRTHWRAYATICIAAVGLVAVLAVLASGPSKPHFWVDDEAEASTSSSTAMRGNGVLAESDIIKNKLPAEVVAAMNFSTHPCDNFYEYVCGNWVRDAVIPPSKSSLTKSWDGAGNTVHQEMLSLFTDEWPAESPYKRLHDWYKSCMNLDYIDEQGWEPLRPMLERIEAMTTLEDLQDLLVDFSLWDLPSFLNLDVSVGVRAPGTHILFVEAGGIVLPDPGYYNILWNGTYDDDQAEDREHMRQYFIRLNELTGLSSADALKVANATIDAETLLAQWQADEPYSEDGDKQGPALTNLTALEALCPSVPWRRIFEATQQGCQEFGWDCNKKLLANENLIVLTAPYFYQMLDEALRGNQTIDFWKPLFRSHYIYNLAPLLTLDFLSANLQLETFLSGITELPKREKKCVGAATNGLSALSDLAFVHKFFSEEVRTEAWDLLHHMKSSFLANLQAVDWMDNATHAAAIRKAEKMGINLGGPPSYKQFVYPVSAESYFNNSGYAYHCKYLRMFIELGERVDETTWNMRASTVNAYYDNGLNAIFIPAGIMQKPFFSHDFPLAQNFGGIGAIMGHEMTHGFDNTGSKFDEDSRMRDWWSQDVKEEFKKRNKCIKKLFNGFEIANTAVNGDETLGENIADSGGAKVAYKAYLGWYRDTRGGDPDGYDKKLFWISYGQNWCSKENSKSVKLGIEGDSHSPNPFRTNGVVSQNTDFAETFSCPVGSPMNPMHKCAMWEQTGGMQSEELVATFTRSAEEEALEGEEEKEGRLTAKQRFYKAHSRRASGRRLSSVNRRRFAISQHY